MMVPPELSMPWILAKASTVSKPPIKSKVRERVPDAFACRRPLLSSLLRTDPPSASSDPSADTDECDEARRVPDLAVWPVLETEAGAVALEDARWWC